KALPGFTSPQWSENTPWGVPAFFLGAGSRGELVWNRFREIRAQADFTYGLGSSSTLAFGGEFSQQRAQTFQRISAYLPVGDSIPPPSAADFGPRSGALYGEAQILLDDIAFTMGVRYDQFDAGSPSVVQRFGPHRTVPPRFAVSTVLNGATVVASWGHFAQAPDFQYLVDATFDDTLRTGRFRTGNPNLGFETATQYEFSVRVRPTDRTAFHANIFVKR